MSSTRAVVYYLTALGGGPIKIGTTVNLPMRLHNLQRRWEAVSLHLLAVEPGDEQVEALRHRQFAHLRIMLNGEWFWPAPDLLQHVEALPRERLGVR